MTGTQLDQLQAEFAPGEHKNRSQGGTTLTYIDISATINRVNAVLGPDWSVVPLSKSKITPPQSQGGPFFAECELFIEAQIDGVTKTLYGVGAMTNKDPDMAVKTALAEAIKKAWHQAGVGLYLWDPEKREAVNAKAKTAKGGLPAKKKAVKALAVEALGTKTPTLTQIAELFNVAPGDLDEEGVLDKILAEGVPA
jgi:hypothetical protein